MSEARPVVPVALQKRGPDDWAFLVAADPAAPFAVGDAVAVAARAYEVLAVEDTPIRGHVNLIVRSAC